MARFPASGARQSLKNLIWDNLKQAIAAVRFQRWQLERLWMINFISSLDHQVRRYLRKP